MWVFNWIKLEWHLFWLKRDCRFYGHKPNIYKMLKDKDSYCTRCGKVLNVKELYGI